MTDTTYMKITAIKQGVPVGASKHVIVETTEKGYIPKDPNNHGYYHIPYAGKVGLIQVFQATEESKARKTEHTDMDIIGMRKPEQATALLWTENGGIVYALHEVLTASERVNTMMQKSIDRNKK